MIPTRYFRSMIAALAILGGACSSSNSPASGNGGTHGTAGASSQVGTTASGGSTPTGGTISTGGTTSSASSGAGTGGVAPATSGTGGAAGGTGGSSSRPATGGSSALGGTTQPGSGGASAAAGSSGTAGGSTTGGATGSGGRVGTGGGSSSGGTPGTGGATAAGGNPGRDGGPATGGAAGGSTVGAAGGATPSSGCGKTPTLKNSPSTSTFTPNTLTVGGQSREFIMRWPDTYKNDTPYRLILDFHGAGGSDKDHAKDNYMGLFPLANGSTIFIALGAVGGNWNATTDATYVDEVLKLVEADLCIDTSRIMLEGFSMGGAMVAVLACGKPGVFRAAVGHSRGGVTAPTTCQPIPYLGSLGLTDISGNSQATQTDLFAKGNGCSVTTMPLAPTGSHVCTNYTGCPKDKPVIYCSYDGGHGYSPTDSGKSSSWMPAEVWSFFSPI
jgi:poly(3-hydroxybutyrate) depolymerase